MSLQDLVSSAIAPHFATCQTQQMLSRETEDLPEALDDLSNEIEGLADSIDE